VRNANTNCVTDTRLHGDLRQKVDRIRLHSVFYGTFCSRPYFLQEYCHETVHVSLNVFQQNWACLKVYKSLGEKLWGLHTRGRDFENVNEFLPHYTASNPEDDQICDDDWKQKAKKGPRPIFRYYHNFLKKIWQSAINLMIAALHANAQHWTRKSHKIERIYWPAERV
jgi:hypothetical protein